MTLSYYVSFVNTLINLAIHENSERSEARIIRAINMLKETSYEAERFKGEVLKDINGSL